MKFSREFYIPKGAIKIADKQSDAVAYIYETAGRLYGLAFHGRAQKPDWHHSFRNEANRAKKIASHFENIRFWNDEKAKRQAKRKAAGRGLEVGDVLMAMWGYDQTNVDYYEVTKLIGKTMVEIRRIGSLSVETGSMQGKSTPKLGAYIGKPMRKKAENGAVRIASYCSAYLMKPQAAVGGVKIYGATNWTSYA